MHGSKGKLKLHTKEFLDTSSLHGVRYLTKGGRNILERVMWGAILITAVSAALYIIANLWDKFQTNPTITGLDADFHDRIIPFPAVTLCGNAIVNVNINQLNEFTVNKSDNKTNVTEKNFSQLSFSQINLLDNVSEIKNPHQQSLQELMLQASLKCEYIINNCYWKDKPIKCCDYFKPIFTEHGLCFSFNSIFTSTEKHFKPENIIESDISWSIKFSSPSIIRNKEIGIYLHPWNERLSRENRVHHIWNGLIKTLLFSVAHTYTTKNTRQLSIKQRKCVFPDEIELLVSNEYSYSSCMIQCRIMKSIELCGCISYLTDIDNFPYCNTREGLICLSKYSDKLNDMKICACELSCEHMVYEVEKLITKTKRDKSYNLEVGFVSFPLVRYKREILFGWVGLLGVAGLFLGFSLLSAIEIFYYFTIRPICAWLQDNNDSKIQKIHKKSKKVKSKRKGNEEITPYSISYLP